MRGSLFISYRRSGNQNALAQVERVLVDAFGAAHVFLDKESLRAGDTWADHIHEALRKAAAVVVLYSAEWRGAKPAGGARIDDADDWVRRELEIAHRHGRPVLPLTIDDSPPPTAAQLPASLRFLAQAQFMTLDPSRPEDVVAALRRMIYGLGWWRRLVAQATWFALGILGFVLATYLLLVGSVFDDAFARGAAAMRERLHWHGKSDDIAVVEINDGEFRELFGSRLPLDGEVLAISLDNLRRASERTASCAGNRPVAIAIDLAPPADDHDERGAKALAASLDALSRCRPVVLACPQQVEMRGGAEAESWMLELRQRVAGHGKLVFASTRVDPEGLRHRQHPVELALVAADMAKLPAAPVQSTPFEPWPCSCPMGRASASACESIANGWDPRAVGVKLDAAETRSLGGGLLNIDDVARRRVVMLGANLGAEIPPLDSRGLERMQPAPSATAKQSHLLHGALSHAPHPFHSSLLLLMFGYAWGIAALTLLGGAWLERSSDRQLGRVKAYVLIACMVACSVLLPLLLAAGWPAWNWFAMPLLVLGVLVFGRALLANFELVLRGQPGWTSPRLLWDDLMTSKHKGSAVTRLALFACESVAIVVCWTIALFWLGAEAGLG